MGGARDQPGTSSALEHCRPWGHWGRGQLRVDWGFVECARCRRGIVHSGAECYQQGVCGERAAWGTEALWPAGAHRGILHASQAGRPQRSPESQHLPVPPPPPPVALPALSEKWPPLSFLAFPRAPGRTLPKPPTPGGWAVASAVEKPDTKVPRAQGVGWRALPPHCPLGLCTLRSSTWGVFKDALVTSFGCPDKLRDAPENYPGTPGPRCFRLAVESGVALGSRASSSG